MTVIHLNENIGYPRGYERVTTPESLLAHAGYDTSIWRAKNKPIGESETSRAAYDMWKKEHGISGLTIGNTTLSNTQVIVGIIALAIVAYFIWNKRR